MEWWSNKITASSASFTLDMLKREMQRATICALCGLTVQTGERAYHEPHSRGIVHADCRGKV